MPAYAKEGKVDESIKWLKISIEKGFDNVELLTTDKDLKNIRNTDYFEKFIQDKALGSRYPSLPPASSDKLESLTKDNGKIRVWYRIQCLG